MKCPFCGGRMVAGTFAIDDSFTRLPGASLSSQSLWFQPDEPGQATKKRGELMGSGDSREGWVCRDCYASAIGGPPDVDQPRSHGDGSTARED